MIDGISESPNKDVCMKLCTFFKDKLGILNAGEINFVRCHRLGRPHMISESMNRPKTIIVRFLLYECRFLFFQVYLYLYLSSILSCSFLWFKYISIYQKFNLDKKCQYTVLYSEDIMQILLNSVGYDLIHITYIHIMNECLVSHNLNLFTIDGELCIVLLVDFYSYVHENCCSCFPKYIMVVFLLFSFFGKIFLLPKVQYACLFTQVWSFGMYLLFFLKVDNAYFPTVFGCLILCSLILAPK